MLNLLEWKRDELIDNRLGALELLPFECKQGLLAVKRAECCSVGVKCVVIVLNELTANGIELRVHFNNKDNYDEKYRDEVNK